MDGALAAVNEQGQNLITAAAAGHRLRQHSTSSRRSTSSATTSTPPAPTSSRSRSTAHRGQDNVETHDRAHGDEQTDALDRVREASSTKAHVFHSWSAQKALNPLVIAGGLGTKVWDHAGRRVPRLLQPAGQRQHRPPAPGRRRGDPGAGRDARHDRRRPRQPDPRRGGRAHRRRAPAGFDKVFFTNGGADAIENAIRMARLHTGRRKVLSTYRSYHGNTGAAINRDRRLAAAAQRVRRRPRPLLRARTSTGRSSGPPRPRRSASARCSTCGAIDRGRGAGDDRGDPARVDPRHRRDHDPAAGLPGRASASSPTRTASC